MKKFLILLIICLSVIVYISCEKKPLTLDDETPMKALLKANDKEITDLVLKEVNEKAGVSEEDVSVEYILRDEKSQAIAVKIKINEE